MGKDEYSLNASKIITFFGILLFIIGIVWAGYAVVPDYLGSAPFGIQLIPISLALVLMAVGIAIAFLGWRWSNMQGEFPRRSKIMIIILTIFAFSILSYPFYQAVDSMRPAIGYGIAEQWSDTPSGFLEYSPDTVNALFPWCGTNGHGNAEFNLTLRLENATFATQDERAGNYTLKDNSTMVFQFDFQGYSAIVGEPTDKTILFKINDNVTSFSMSLSFETNGWFNNFWIIREPSGTQINYSFDANRDVFVQN